MAQVLDIAFIKDNPCPYLADRGACHEHRYLLGVTPEEMERMLERGWRRFGLLYFRPVCRGCMECISVRLPVAQFRPSKSQRRAVRKCAAIRVEVGIPTLDERRIALFADWHAMRSRDRGWPIADTSPQSYHWTFCQPNPFAEEMAYFLEDRLVAVGLVDRTPRALSSIYFYYDPEIAPLSPGVFSILCEVEYARRMGLAHVYLGYLVEGCRSVAYKRQYAPQEVLVGRPEDAQEPVWIPAR